MATRPVESKRSSGSTFSKQRAAATYLSFDWAAFAQIPPSTKLSTRPGAESSTARRWTASVGGSSPTTVAGSQPAARKLLSVARAAQTTSMVNTPALHMSALHPSYSPITTSGATNGKVPHELRQGVPRVCTARSKSTSLTVMPLPSIASADTAMFSGLMSRWQMRGPVCMWSMAPATCCEIWASWRRDNGRSPRSLANNLR
mmetsp:Transcript_126532/g.248068  ORF Transcript_126532/g.248068 Transcript_126532/m.248068 type:complete len:202 (+) Transcript_126532:77-682(+)